MNEIHVPIEEVHLETVFEGGQKREYALLQPQDQLVPLRVRFEDLRDKLGERFSHELSADEIVARLAFQDDMQLVVQLSTDGAGKQRWQVGVTYMSPAATPRSGSQRSDGAEERRRARRVPPERATDIKLEVGPASVEGMLYNVSEHGLGIALLTDSEAPPEAFRVDQVVELVGRERIRGRVASQYPAPGGCVLGIELKERFDYARLYGADA